jgi:hypothetical protein
MVENEVEKLRLGQSRPAETKMEVDRTDLKSQFSLYQGSGSLW